MEFKNKTDEELKQMTDSELFEYLDAKAAYLKQNARPLSGYLTKKYASISSAVADTEFDYDGVTKIAKQNESASMEIFMNRIKDASNGI
jgi:hypothetical protein